MTEQQDEWTPVDRPGFEKLGDTGTSAIVEITKAALHDLPAPFRIRVALPGIGAVLFLILGLGLLTAGVWLGLLPSEPMRDGDGEVITNKDGEPTLIGASRPWLAGLTLLGTIGSGFLGYRLLVLSLEERRNPIAVRATLPVEVTADPDTAPILQRWSRPVPTLPIDPGALHEVRELLENLRNAAYVFIQGTLGKSNLDVKSVRVNVFIPDTRGVAGDGTCELHIPSDLHLGIDPAEESLRFWPNQGITGVVFASEREQTARSRRAGDGAYAWPDKFRLTDAQKERIHSDLRWIVSYPLKRSQRADTFGVLNIDGIGFDLTDDELDRLKGAILNKTLTVAGRLNQEPFHCLAVTVEG